MKYLAAVTFYPKTNTLEAAFDREITDDDGEGTITVETSRVKCRAYSAAEIDVFFADAKITGAANKKPYKDLLGII